MSSARRDIVIVVCALAVGGAFFWYQRTHAPIVSDATPDAPTAQSEEIVPSGKLFVRTAGDRGEGELTLQDIPSVSAWLIPSRAQLSRFVYRESIFMIADVWKSGERRQVLRYAWPSVAEGPIAQFNPRSGVCDDPVDLAVVGDLLALACRKQGVVVIHLPTETVMRVYDTDDGLRNLQNLEFSPQDSVLWVGTFNGVGRIDLETQEVTFFQQELGTKGSWFSARVIAAEGERGAQVWALVIANAESAGSASLLGSDGSWRAFGPEDFGMTDGRVDFRRFVVAPSGTFAAVHGGSESIIFQFDAASSSWREMQRFASAGIEVLDAALPPRETYTEIATAPRDPETAMVPFRVFVNGSWETVDVGARAYAAMSPPLADGSRYLLSDSGFEHLDADAAFPSLVAPSWPETGGMSFAFLRVTRDERYIVGMRVGVNDMGGGIEDASVAVFDRAFGTIIARPIREEDRWRIPTAPPTDDSAEMSVASDGSSFVLTGLINEGQIRLSPLVEWATVEME